MSDAELASTAVIDYIRPIIADADTATAVSQPP